MTSRFLPLALLAMLALAGCAATQPGVEEEPEAEPEMTEEEAQAAAEAEEEARAMGGADCPPTCDFARDAIEDPDSALADRVIYFAFDSSTVDSEYMEIIQRHAAYLSQYPGIEVRVEGHTDERGSREYNIGLGSRRAESVSRLLQVNGASSDQIETISYGEEVPAVEGHNEEAWSKNRRVELVYPAGGN